MPAGILPHQVAVCIPEYYPPTNPATDGIEKFIVNVRLVMMQFANDYAASEYSA